MQTVLIIVHLIIVLALIGVVLLQRSEGGGMGLGGGGGGGVSGFMTGRGQANALTRATAILAALFFATSIALTLLATSGRGPRSILDGAAPAGTTQQAPASGQGGNVLEQLQRMQGEQPAAPGAPAPSAPAPAAPAPAPAPTTPQVPQSQ
jgi:preprotein translocase subunit SecG